MTQQYVPNLGERPNEDARRDAVHIAVAPITAPCDLEPCTHVDALGNPNGVTGVGIVDPYLRRTVRKGERFWLFLYPNTVTSLRHQWTHPAFRSKLKDNL